MKSETKSIEQNGLNDCEDIKQRKFHRFEQNAKPGFQKAKPDILKARSKK